MRRVFGILVTVGLLCTAIRADSIVLTPVIHEPTSFQGRRDVRLQYLSSQVPTFASVQSESAGQITRHPFAEMFFGPGFSEYTGRLPLSFDAQQLYIPSISPGDVQAVICDCGEIAEVAGGFPKWPFLFLGAIPFLFIHNGNPESPLPPVLVPPTATPRVESPPQIPEPDSFVLLVTGLAGIVLALRNRKLTTRSPRIDPR